MCLCEAMQPDFTGKVQSHEKKPTWRHCVCVLMWCSRPAVARACALRSLLSQFCAMHLRLYCSTISPVLLSPPGQSVLPVSNLRNSSHYHAIVFAYELLTATASSSGVSSFTSWLRDKQHKLDCIFCCDAHLHSCIPANRKHPHVPAVVTKLKIVNLSFQDLLVWFRFTMQLISVSSCKHVRATISHPW